MMAGHEHGTPVGADEALPSTETDRTSLSTQLSPEEAWGFEVHGFIIVRNALSGSQLVECQALAARGVTPAPGGEVIFTIVHY